MRVRFTKAQFATFTLLFSGYIGYYLTRKNISIAQISLKDLGLLTKEQIGIMMATATLSYAIGKFINGFLSDYIGGKRTFLLGMLGSVTFTTLFTLGESYSWFVVMWCLNNFFLSMGWAGLIRVSSYWYGVSEKRGTIVGLLSYTYQLGSIFAKSFTTFLTTFAVLVWEGLFLVPAAVLFLMAILVFFLLKEHPSKKSEALEMSAKELKQFKKEDKIESHDPVSWVALFKSPAFLLIVWASVGLTLVRTFFEDFSAIWLSDAGYSLKTAGYASVLVPLAGMAATLFAGWFSDRMKGNRGPIIVLSAFALSGALFLQPILFKNLFGIQMFLTLCGFLIYASYTLVAGVSAIDFGGTKNPSAAAGIVDGFGYLGASLGGVFYAYFETSTVVFWFAGMSLVLGLSLIPLIRIYPKKPVVR